MKLSGLFRVYRTAIAPAIGPVCRFYPSCSHYAQEAVDTWGLGRGLLLTGKRLLRCHPFAAGGLDPVPARPIDHAVDHAVDRPTDLITDSGLPPVAAAR